MKTLTKNITRTPKKLQPREKSQSTKYRVCIYYRMGNTPEKQLDNCKKSVGRE